MIVTGTLTNEKLLALNTQNNNQSVKQD